MELKHIKAFTLADYTQQLLEAGKDGWQFSTDNAHYPRQFNASWLECTLVKGEALAGSALAQAKPKAATKAQ